MAKIIDTNERKRNERDRKRALGLVRIEAWVKPENAQPIRELIKKIEAS